MTNFEKIKAMSVEEMAKVLFDKVFDAYEWCKNFTECVYMVANNKDTPDKKCICCVQKWLESEVEE